MLVLLEHGCTVTLIDNLSNSFLRVFEHMKKIAGAKASSMKFAQVGLPVCPIYPVNHPQIFPDLWRL